MLNKPVIIALLIFLSAGTAMSQPVGVSLDKALPQITTPGGTQGILGWVVMITVFSIAPAIIVMVTSFTRIAVVLGLLRQGLGTQQLPPNQIIFGLALIMTAVVMTPTYSKLHTDAIKPYMDKQLDGAAAIKSGETHVRDFMIMQMKKAGNERDVYIFLDDHTAAKENISWADIPTVSLIPAFVVSELKVAFWMGVRILLPFVVIDLLVSAILVSMGMLMVPPVMISLPFKLLLFVLADGWALVIGSLIKSF